MRKYLAFLALPVCFLSAEARGLLSEAELEAMRLDVSSYPQVGSVSLVNLDLNRQGTVLIAYPGEKVRATVNISCEDKEIDPHTLYQVIVGYEDGGPQKCILNEFGYRLGDAIRFFFLEAPSEPGEYNIQFRLEETPSPLEAMQNWGRESSLQMTIGKIIVVE